MVSLLTLVNSVLVKAAFAAEDISAVDKTVTPFPNLGDLLSSAIQISLLIAGIIVLFMIILGGIQYVSSGGDKEAATSAKSRITAALVGLLIVVSAYAIAVIIEKVFGIRIVSGVTFPAAKNIVGD